MNVSIKDVLESARDTLDMAIRRTSQKYQTINILRDLRELSDRFDQLRESNLSNNNQIQLFCRQLKRLIDNNRLCHYRFWHDIYHYLIYMLDELNSKEITNTNLKLFHKRITFEKELEQRQEEFRKNIIVQMNLQQLIKKHESFFKKYLKQCISLHSTVKVIGLVENIDDFLCKNYGLTHLSLTQEKRQRLEEKLKCIDIPLNYLDRSLMDKNDVFSTDAKLKKPIDSRPDKFLTSAQLELNLERRILSITEVLQTERWLVILSDPGNGKTTLLRSIMYIYANALYHGRKEVFLGGHEHTIFRIPMLIRMDEFASWLEDNQTKTLIDYIGEHTWLSEKYCQNYDGNVFKELIDHGHALILLDGLDEIPKVSKREKVVELIREFIREYVKDPNFISAFDEKLFDFFEPRFRVAEAQPPSKVDGNQIIITSRIVGYDMNSLTGTFITHCLLLPMDRDEVNKFTKKWMLQVEQVVHQVLFSMGFSIDKQTIESLSQRRIKAVKSMFENDEKSLYLSSSLLTFICTIIFQSSNHSKSRVETFHRVTESAIRFWTKDEPKIFSELLSQFLINLATYLHLKSSSDLIDTFDITRLARLTVKQQYMTNNGAELRVYGDKLLNTLKSDIGLVAERDLEVFAFQHSSFQEYFVAQFLVKRHFTDQNIRKEYSIEEISNRILLNTINPRFRQPFLMALDWISSKWSFDDFDQFCTVFVRSNKNYSIPLGALHLFEAFHIMQRLPSESIIFTALNNLLDHPSNMVAKEYLIPNLIKLSGDTIQKWMSNYLKDDKSLSKFCQCLLIQFQRRTKIWLPDEEYQKSKLSVIFKQLYSFYNESTSAKFVVDQTLRRIMMLTKASDDIFPHRWSSYLRGQKIDLSTIHPLILSILIVVCGEVIWKQNYGTIKTYWSHKRMYRESSIIEPIIEYLRNQKEFHSIKVQILITQYKRDIEKASPSDTSGGIVDTFVALICLHEISDLYIIEKYLKYQALPMAFDKIKQAFFFIRKMFCEEYSGKRESVETLFKDQVELILKTFDSHSHQDNQQHSDYSTTYNIVLKKLFIQWSVESFSRETLYEDEDNCLESRSEIGHLHGKYSRSMQEDSEDDLSSLLTFVPESLQKLYYYLFINPSDKTDSLPLVVFLAQCLTYLENMNKSSPNFSSILTKLETRCQKHMLENYLSVLRFKTNLKKEDQSKELLKATDELTLSESMCINPCDNWKNLIDIECQRISEANNIKQNNDKNCRLFAASICLTQLSQVQYYSPSYDSTTNNTLSSFENISNAIRSIDNPILQIIALNMILEIKDPVIFDEKERNNLDLEMTCLLRDFSSYPLLTLTFIFVRIHTQQKDFPMISLMIKMIGKRFGETRIDEDSHSREAVLNALKQLGHSYYILKSFDPTEWNSSLLFRYFNNATSFKSLNTTVLSLIYVTELAFDTHLLQIYTNDHYKNKIFYLGRIMSQGNDLSNDVKIMTYEAAMWITNYLQKPMSTEGLRNVITIMLECLIVEKKALSVIEKWLIYRNEKNLRKFAQYAALQLFIEQPNLLQLLDIINEIFTINDRFHVNSLIEYIFNSRVDDFNILRQILIRWQKNPCYSSHISIWISHEKIFDSILNLDFERVTQNKDKPSGLPLNSFLFIINGCSYDLEVKLKQYLQTFIEQKSANDDIVKEQYIANIIKWIIENKIWNAKNKKFSEELYEYVFSFVHHQADYLVQKAIVNGLYSVVITSIWEDKEHTLLTKNVILHLVTIISSYNKYPEDVLAVCLLIYSIYPRMLQQCDTTYCISDNIQGILATLFTASSSTNMISIRAALCLLITEQSSTMFNEIPQWFKEKWKLTDENEYDLLLQRTLIEMDDRFPLEQSPIVYYISNHSDTCLHKFVRELKDDLHNKCNNWHSTDPSPNYVEIANEFSKEIFQKFQHTLQANSIDEAKLKSNLCNYAYHAKTEKDFKVAVKLYEKFGILTEELIRMLEWAEIRYASTTPFIFMTDIKDVSDREVITILFKKLKLFVDNGNFKFSSFILRLLIQLANVGVVSSLEIHQEVSDMINTFSHDNKLSDWFREESILNELLNLGSIIEKRGSFYMDDKIELFNESDVDLEFEKKIDQLKYLSM